MIGSLKGQIKIGDNPQTLNPASVLELESSSRVLVITRVTTAQMNTITPLRGALVYNTDVDCIHYYNGTDWINICEALDNSFTVSTEAVFNQFSRDSTVVITQTDDNYNFEVNLISGIDNIIPSTINGELHIQQGSIRGPQIHNSTITFDKLAVGENTGELLRWEGGNTGWVLVNQSDLGITEDDGIIGNEVLDATAGGSLVRSGGGTGPGDSFTLDVADGGIDTEELANNAVINDKLDKGNIPLSGFGAATTDVNLGLNKLVNVDNPTNPQDAATMAYVDAEILASNQIIVSADTGNLIVASGTDGGAFYNGDFANLINIPIGLGDGDDDTTYSAGAGMSLVGTTFSVNDATIAPAWGNITGIPLDIADGDADTTYSAGAGMSLVGTTFSVNDATIAPAWGNITGIPLDIADGDADTTYSAGAGMSLVGTTFSVNDATIAPAWGNITGIPLDIADGDADTTYSAGAGMSLVGTTFSVNDATIAPAWGNITGIPLDIADGDADTTYSAGAGMSLVGTTFSVNDATIAPAWGNITGIPLDIADGDADTTYSAGAGLNLVGTTFSVNNATIAPAWGNITGIPLDIADGDADTTYSAGAGMSLVGTTFSVDNLAGDVTGPTSATVIANGVVTSAKIAINTITDANIAATAAIDGSKINPDFVSDVTTTGDFISGGVPLTVPDFVFEQYFDGFSNLNANYRLKSLKEVEAFVREHKHLPGIKSASEVKASGEYRLTESSLGHLEKIEELFLHTIEQEKKIEQLKSEKEALTKELELLKADVEQIKALLLSKKER